MRLLNHIFIALNRKISLNQFDNIKLFVIKANTITAKFKNSGMLHQEGGWPKDINKEDPEATQRYRRKIEKDEPYIHTMLQLLPVIQVYKIFTYL